VRVRETVWRGDRGEGTVFYRLDRDGKRASANLYVGYRAEGKEQVKSALTADLTEAKKELKRLTRNRANADEGLDVLRTPALDRMTVAQLIEGYLVDHGSMSAPARPVIAGLGGVKVTKLNPDHVRGYKELRKASVTSATIANELGVLRAAYKFAASEGRLRFVPFIKMPSFDNARKVFFPLERVPELIEVTERINPCISDFFAWQSFSGMRPKAIRLLRWSDLDVSDWILTLDSRRDKSKFGRDLAIDGEARQILERRRVARQPGDLYIFGGARPVSHSMLLRVWNRALAEMELPCGMKDGYTPYDLKKTALRAIRRSGVPEERAMFFSGHKTARTFRRYDLTANEDNREDMAKVTEYRRRRFADKEGEKTDKGSKLLRIQREDAG
jgi:integrase